MILITVLPWNFEAIVYIQLFLNKKLDRIVSEFI